MTINNNTGLYESGNWNEYNLNPLTRIDRRDDDVVEDSNLGQPLAVSAREANFRPRSNRGSRAHGWMGATMRDTQADVPSA